MITIEVVVRSVLTVTATLIAAVIIGQLGITRAADRLSDPKLRNGRQDNARKFPNQIG